MSSRRRGASFIRGNTRADDEDIEDDASDYDASWIVDDDVDSDMVDTDYEDDDDVQVVEAGVEYSPVDDSSSEEETSTIATRTRNRTSPDHRRGRNINARGRSSGTSSIASYFSRGGQSESLPSTSSHQPHSNQNNNPVPVSTVSSVRRTSNEMELADSPIKSEKKLRSSQSPKKELSQNNNDLNSSATISDDGSTCTICFERWTSSDGHKLVSLNCGHLFGKECIEKWIDTIKKPAKPHCPQCKQSAKKKDLRPIFAKRIRMVDTSDVLRLETTVQEQKRRMVELEMKLIKEKESKEKLATEAKEYKMKLLAIEEKYKMALSKSRKTMIESTNIPRNSCSAINRNVNYSPSKFPQFEKKTSVEICNKLLSCRVLSSSKTLNLITVTQEFDPWPDSLAMASLVFPRMTSRRVTTFGSTRSHQRHVLQTE